MKYLMSLIKPLFTLLLLTVLWSASAEDALPQQIQLALYKNANCGCCDKWAQHLDSNQFSTEIHVSENLNQLKQELGISSKMASCHTGVVKHEGQKYIFEGHIPAKFIHQFLDNPPQGAIGLSVPAMPVGSPGMEYQDKFMPYKVFQLHKNGQVSIYAEVSSAEEQH
jgi:hypothetical protein